MLHLLQLNSISYDIMLSNKFLNSLNFIKIKLNRKCIFVIKTAKDQNNQTFAIAKRYVIISKFNVLYKLQSGNT